jgi:beta-phosphoglucomutase family hydrolase
VPSTSPVRLDRKSVDAVVFDLDGVVTRTAIVHARAWKRLFDAFLEERSRRLGEPFVPFDIEADYLRHVDGKPREDGVADFLASRGIDLSRGDPSDPPDRETVHGLGNRKDTYFQEALAREGVEVYESTVELIRVLRGNGVRTAIVSSSRNCGPVLAAAGLTDLFDVKVDGIDAAELGLPGKPDPAMFLEAARRLGVDPARAAVFEDALAGVQAGRRGGFALVVGVDRGGNRDGLLASGATAVVDDLAEVSAEQ